MEKHDADKNISSDNNKKEEDGEEEENPKKTDVDNEMKYDEDDLIPSSSTSNSISAPPPLKEEVTTEIIPMDVDNNEDKEKDEDKDEKENEDGDKRKVDLVEQETDEQREEEKEKEEENEKENEKEKEKEKEKVEEEKVEKEKLDEVKDTDKNQEDSKDCDNVDEKKENRADEIAAENSTAVVAEKAVTSEGKSPAHESETKEALEALSATQQDVESTEISNTEARALSPAPSESKVQATDSPDPKNPCAESPGKIQPLGEDSEELNPPEKSISASETPIAEEKPMSEPLKTLQVEMEPPIEDNVPENRKEASEVAEESRDKNIPDFEDSSSSIAELSKYQGGNNAEESETNKQGDSGGSESNFEQNQEKNSVAVEPENTEFVQISQEDKHDESQIENQSIDNAEDPFGGDNLNSEHLEENMETDDHSGEISDLQKLGDQADNLQAVVKAKDNFQPDKSSDDSTQKEISDDLHSEKLPEVPENKEENTEKEAPAEKEQKNDENSEKTCKDDERNSPKDQIPALETEQVASDVLPGQDDELCIIPDSMKVILPRENVVEGKETTEEKSAEEEAATDTELVAQGTEGESNDKSCPEKENEETSVPEELPKEKEPAVITLVKKGTGVSAQTTKSASALTNVVINIDDESKNSEIEEIETKEKCKQCGEEKSCKIKVKVGLDSFNVCSKECRNTFKAANNKATDIPSDGVNSKREKRCAGCLLIVEAGDERNLSWETMEFCNEECLGKFQTKYGSYCRNCNGSVQAVSLGKYCVRFGYDVRQFCCSICLEEFKKGLKVCSYCQKDISSGTEGFLAPVGDKGQFKDFCTQDCMEKYSRMSSADIPNSQKKACSVCQEEKIVHCEVQINGGGPVAICSDPCFAAFKFVNKVDPDQCSTCKKFFQLLSKKNFVVFYEGEAHMFCNKTCLNVFIITNRKIVPCNWCKVKKYNFDMIKKELKSGQIMMMCSLNCLTLYQVSINAVSARRINCDFCKEYSQAQYHLTMSDATIRNFCSYKCVMNFQGQYTKSPITIPAGDDPVPTGNPKRALSRTVTAQGLQKTQQSDIQGKNLPVISSVTSLAAIGNGQNCSPASQQQNNVGNLTANVPVQAQNPPQVIYMQQVIARPTSPAKVHNRTTQCKPLMHTKGVSVKPHPCTKSTQTENDQQIVIPIPVPIYVPFPMHMYSMPFPVPFPFPLPIPVPIFIPTTRNSAKGIFKDIKRIQEKIPADPFEAELLMMAEMVAKEKKHNESDSEDDDDNRDEVADVPANPNSEAFSPEGVDSNNTFGDDMLQMALKMATGELDEPAVDLEAALTPNTITATQAPPQQDSAIDGDGQPERLMVSTRGRKRMVPYKPRSTPSKRGRRVTGSSDLPLMPPPEPQPPPQQRIMEPIEKPDANMALKYTFGVNAWRQWVIAKNAELEKQSTPTRRVKLFKTELLQLTADELNYTLCLFVKEVRKPNGAEYAPDTIYYLCLGIQQYLFENNRIDNIFTDSYYEKFTDCLNDVAKKFSVLYNDAQYIVTRVEEEHLWESKQLGAHSPHVLLSTLMFFNTKHFNLVTVDEHMQLSFSHIMKHWKRNPAAQPAAVAGKAPGSRNVLLRFYPPQSALEANSRKKKVYEQQENEENPLRCPVKLYEFYLSKCPESVKTRNDVFYLLPERSCVPDSPVWYSTSPLAKEHLIKMLYRVKMVKEINVALLTS